MTDIGVALEQPKTTGKKSTYNKYHENANTRE